MEDENKEEEKVEENDQEVVDDPQQDQELSSSELNEKIKESKYDWASLVPIIVFAVILVGLVIALLVIIYA